MSLKSILQNLDDSQRRREKMLRAKVLEEFKNRGRSRLEIGRLMAQLHDELIGEKLFKKYLSALGIPRSSAYHMMDAYRELPKLPDPILLAAGKRGIDLALAKYRTVVPEIPLPENPEEDANKWLDDILARYRELKAKRSEASKSTPLSAERRDALTVETLDKHFKKLDLVVGSLWNEVPAEKRSLEVIRSLVGEFAASLGFTEEFTVTPNPKSGKSAQLVKQLQARVAPERRKQRCMPTTDDLWAMIPTDAGESEPGGIHSVA